MRRFWISWFLPMGLALPLVAQGQTKAPATKAPAAKAPATKTPATKTLEPHAEIPDGGTAKVGAAGSGARPKVDARESTSSLEPVRRHGAGAPSSTSVTAPVSAAGRTALQRCRELARRVRDRSGSERLTALAEAAANYDRVADGFAREPRVAARAAFAAAELWRRHGSLAIAERSYGAAALLDRGRYGARGLLGVADMQRRQGRRPAALSSYSAVIEGFPAAGYAQQARLARARLLRSMGRLETAVGGARAALECARPGRQLFDACNLLALLLIESGDLAAAESALAHARKSIAAAPGDDPITRQRWQKAVDGLSGWRALRRAKDRATGAARDAVRFDQDRRRVVPDPPLQ